MIVFIAFIALAGVVVFFSTRLAKEAEIIEVNSNINAALIGVLLAIATSLPELATGIASLFLKQPQMAIGNVLGSNLFNFLILAIFNVIYFRMNIFKGVKKSLDKIIFFILLMYINFLVTAIIFTNSLFLTRFEIGSIVIVIIYIIAIKNIKVEDGDQEELEKIKSNNNVDLNKSVIRFIINAIIILLASVLLAQNANKIVIVTGLEASVVGALFIGISTSLPELITAYTLVKQKNFTMSASSVLSSNLFNFVILAILDFLSKTPLYAEMDTALNGYVYLGILFCMIYFIQISYKKLNNYASSLLSCLMLIIYVSFFIYIT